MGRSALCLLLLVGIPGTLVCGPGRSRPGTDPGDRAVRSEADAPILAHYTRLPYDDGGNSGKYADVVVRLPGRGNFVFSREYGYQPCWQPAGGGRHLVERLIPRAGDGPGERPDRINRCSDARIVENGPAAVKVHWRYAPDVTKASFTDYLSAYNNAGDPSSFFAEFVDEYFTLGPEGDVLRQVKEGCTLLDDWNDPENVTIQKMRLTPDGIIVTGLSRARRQDLPRPAIRGEALKAGGVGNPVAWFRFDEGLGPNGMTTREAVSQVSCAIRGVKAHWRPGVSGTCLSFDSYSNAVVMPSAKIPGLRDPFTVEAWIAPQEYPFNWAAIVDHARGSRGYFLGMNARGEIGFHAGVGETWTGVQTGPVPLYKWCHIVGTYDRAAGFAVYLNGALAAQKGPSGDMKDAEGVDLHVGMTRMRPQHPAGAERGCTKAFGTFMVFSGLIDEVRIFDRALSAGEVVKEYDAVKPENGQPLRPWVLPAGPASSPGFKAAYTTLRYSPEWDGLWRVGDYADLVVSFEGKPWRYVFWRGTRLLPSLVTEPGPRGIWNNDQGPECYTDQCHEHMSDMLNRFVKVRLVEDSDARKVIHWRNASVSISYRWPKVDPGGWGIWTDEYWTLYPDGVAVRHQVVSNPTAARINCEMNQNELLHQPGQATEDLIPDGAITVANTAGGTQTFYRSRGPGPDPGGDKNLQFMNLKSATRHFEIGEVGARVEVFLANATYWTGWNHYPVQLIPSDGTVAYQYDRPSSTCTSTLREVRRPIDGSHLEAMVLYGLTEGGVDGLTGLNRSWNDPPPVTGASGCAGGYEKRERAYIFEKQGDTMRFSLEASDRRPIHNLAFVIRRWGRREAEVMLKVDAMARTAGQHYRRGVVVAPDGSYSLVLWVPLTAVKETSFEIALPWGG